MENASALTVILRRWWIVAMCAFLGAAIGGLPGTKAPEDDASATYRATHTMLINDTAALREGTSNVVSASQVPLLATTGEVPARVAEQLGADVNAATLASQIVVVLDPNTGALSFTTTQSSPERAEELADAFATTLNAYLAERQDQLNEVRLAASINRLADLETRLDVSTQELAGNPEDATLLAQRDALARQYSVAFEQNQFLSQQPSTLSFTTIEYAQAVQIAQTGLAAPRSRSVRAVMGFAVGGAIGAVIALVAGRVDRRLRTRDQAEALIGLRARVGIPKSRDPGRDLIVVHTGRHDALSDAYRTVRNLVGFVQQSLEPVTRARVTVVVSPGPGDGKTSLAGNLAAAFVETGQRTIVVNTDFRRPRLSKACDIEFHAPHPFTLGDLEVIEPKSLLVGVQPGMLVLDLAGVDGSAGELARSTAAMVPTLTEMADAVVIDTSPVGATAEVLDVLPLADVIVRVVRLGHTSIGSARRAISVLRDVSDAPILLVVNSVKQERSVYAEYTDRPRRARSRSAQVESSPRPEGVQPLEGWRTWLPNRREHVESESIG